MFSPQLLRAMGPSRSLPMGEYSFYYSPFKGGRYDGNSIVHDPGAGATPRILAAARLTGRTYRLSAFVSARDCKKVSVGWLRPLGRYSKITFFSPWWDASC